MKMLFVKHLIKLPMRIPVGRKFVTFSHLTASSSGASDSRVGVGKTRGVKVTLIFPGSRSGTSPASAWNMFIPRQSAIRHTSA